MITDIPFHRIPHQSELFLSYLRSSPAAMRFYRYAPTFESLKNAARMVARDVQFPRSEVASILRRQNESYGCDAATRNRIHDLEQPDCVAVVTGQQVGLFTGPLYTVYKALTAIRLAAELEKSGIKAVPVFWMETEDHDLVEVTRRTVLSPGLTPESIDYREILFGPDMQTSNASVGSVRFPGTIVQTVQDYIGHLPEGRGKAEVESHLQSAYRPGSGFAQAFGDLMAHMFPGSGLVLFNPSDIEAKRLNSAVFRKAVEKETDLRRALLQRSEELEQAGFHSQVSILENSTVLFYIEDGQRRALERREPGFALKNTDRVFSPDELLEDASRAPEKFSPNVLLRPLIQDHLFPTVAYIGGSAELAYFAQIQVLYELYGRPMPVLWPRDSFTLVEPEAGSEMDRMGIELEDLFKGEQFLMEKAMRTSGVSQASARLDELREYLDEALSGIKPRLQSLEPPLAQALETARRKILHNVQHLKTQAVRLEGSQNSTIARTVNFLLNTCYPNQTLQERELGIHHFLSRHGSPVLDIIRSAVKPGFFVHRVIRL